MRCRVTDDHDPYDEPPEGPALAHASEQIVLGGAMLNGALVEQLVDVIRLDSFADQRHRQIWAAITALALGGGSTDSTAVAVALNHSGELKQAGGFTYLYECVAAVPTGAMVPHHARLVAEASRARRQHVTAARLTQAAGTDGFRSLLEAALDEHERTLVGRLLTIDLGPYLDGEIVHEEPTIGAHRDDGHQALYAGKWHTLIAPNESGKSWFAMHHVVVELHRGNHVVYGHFEEPDPTSTIARARALGASDEQLREQLVWLDLTKAWTAEQRDSQMAAIVAARTGPVTLVVLDGINAACSMHGWDSTRDPAAIGAYRTAFVRPAAVAGAAVLSLGHPPKAKDRQDDRHGYGSTAWLDEVDGAAFRLLADPQDPIGRGVRGSSALSCVKDRPGNVKLHGQVRDDDATSAVPGWVYWGQFVVDDTGPEGETTAGIYLGDPPLSDATVDEVTTQLVLDAIKAANLAGHEPSLRSLAKEIKVKRATIAKARDQLVAAGCVKVRDGPRGSQMHVYVHDP